MDILLMLPSFQPMWKKKKISLQPGGNFRNSVHHFNSALFFFEQNEWQPLSHQNQGVSHHCFTASEMLAYPLAYIISPAALLGGGRRRRSAGRQVVKFPLAGPTLPPSGWLLQGLRFDSRSGPRSVWEAASSDSGLSPMCLLTDREATEPSKRPKLLSF